MDVEEGGECDESSDIAGMGLTTLCELEYDDAARFEAAAAEDDDDDDDDDDDGGNDGGGGGGGGEHDENDRHQQRTFRGLRRRRRRRRRQANDALGTLLKLVSSEDMPRGGPRHFFRLDPRRFALSGHTPMSISAVGLALDATGIAFVMRNFPSLCAYDADEVEELVTFLLRPLPEPGAFPSVAMVADGSRFGGDGADVDCEFLRGFCPRLVHLDVVRRQRIDPFTRITFLSLCLFFFFHFSLYEKKGPVCRRKDTELDLRWIRRRGLLG